MDSQTRPTCKLQAASLLSFLLGALLLDSSAFCMQRQAVPGQGLLPPRDAVPQWYNRDFYYTNWPDEERLSEVSEVPDVKYSHETLINEVMQQKILERDWQAKVLRVKGWIPKSIHGRTLDAYLYRQSYKDSILHICDTRPRLLIAFASKTDESFLEDPNKCLTILTSELFQFELPLKYKFSRDEKTGMFKARAKFNDERLRSEITQERASELLGTHKGPSSFSLFITRGPGIAIFDFQKSDVPGCVLDTRYPLFREVSAQPYPGELVLEKLKDFEKPVAKDIPELLKMLSDLPKTPSIKQLMLNPYETRYLTRAKIGIVKALTNAMKSIEGGDHTEIELIKQALKAEKYIQHAEENPQRWHVFRLKEAAVDALYRIRSDEAAMLHFEIINREKDPDNSSTLIKGLGKYRIFRERLKKMYEEAKAEGRSITKYEMYEKLREEISQESPVSSDATEGRASVEEAPFHEKGTKILMLSIPSVAALFTFVGIFVLLKKKKVSSHSK